LILLTPTSASGTLTAMTPWSQRLPGLAYGGDYNPEQWPEETWADDVRLMRQAGVTVVTVGVFSWALIEAKPGVYEFGWLDRVMDLLHDGGIAVDLATATASPPPWLSLRHPEMLPVTADGTTLWPGGRQAWCPSSPVYRAHAVALAEQMATRYASHPALVMWHVSNEIGCHNAHCYCDVSAAAFRRWLQRRYTDLDTLNAAWGTNFWSQRYAEWAEILPPRSAPNFANPTQQLDFARFSSDELLDCFRAERDVLHQHSPGVPVTTNFMAGMARPMDYWAWAGEVDVVSNDHYVRGENPEGHIDLAFSADLTRGLAGGAPWLLMEHSTSAVNWQPRNIAKQPGQLARNSLAHVARGSEGALFFQWRASQAGAEKYHSAMLPHAGTNTRTWREVTELGEILAAAGDLRGTTVHADVALVFDWQSWWAAELDSHPSIDVAYLDQVHAYYTALWRAGVTVDIVGPTSDLTGYRLVVVPTLYLADDTVAPSLERHVQGGGSLLITYFSGIVDENDHIRLGGYPGAFRELLGIRSEEFFPLRLGESVQLDDGSTATVWTEHLHLEGAEALASYTDGPLPGTPALTRRAVDGGGAAWYVATRLDADATDALIARLLTEADVRPVVQAVPGLEAVRRSHADGRTFLFLLNHTDAPVDVATKGADLVTGKDIDGIVTVPPGGVALIRERG